MSTIGNVVCKAVGVAGVSAVVYDAYKIGREMSVRVAQAGAAGHYEQVVADTRTASTESHITNALQNKTAEMRMNNPILPVIGKTKGFIMGALDSLGTNVIPVIFSSIAILTKGFMSKIGAFGLLGCGIYTVLKEGFGIGKHSPVEKAQ